MVYVINNGEYAYVGTHWIDLYVKSIEIIYFDSLWVENVSKEIRKLFGHKKIKTNICRIQTNHSITCGDFWIGFIDFIFAGKTFIGFNSFVSPYDLEKNYDIILCYFKND